LLIEQARKSSLLLYNSRLKHSPRKYKSITITEQSQEQSNEKRDKVVKSKVAFRLARLKVSEARDVDKVAKGALVLQVNTQGVGEGPTARARLDQASHAAPSGKEASARYGLLAFLTCRLDAWRALYSV